MEIEYHDPSRRGKYIVAVGLVLALIAGAGAFIVISQAQQAGRPDLPTSAVVVAAKEIPARAAITPEDLEVRQVPMDDTTAEGIFAHPAKIVGLVAGTTILKGQPVFANMLAGQTQGSQFSILGPNETISPDSRPGARSRSPCPTTARSAA